MSNLLRLAIIQMNIEAGNPDRNFARMEEKLAEATALTPKPDLIVLPEMWNTGYALQEIQTLADPEGERTKRVVSAFCREHGIGVYAGSIANRKQSQQVVNTSFVFDVNGDVVGEYSKIHLFQLMNEHLHLEAGGTPGQLALKGHEAGMMICYDLRFPELARKLALGGAKILFVPAQWPHPRLHHWRTLLQARAIENQLFVVSCNTVGESGGSSFFGHSMVVDPWGQVLAEGQEEEAIITAEIDLALVDEVRGRIPVFADRRPELYS